MNKLDLARSAVDAYEKEYADHWRHWEALDGKANAAISTSGILLGALIAFGDRFSELHWTLRLSAVAAIIATIATIGFALWASRIATVNYPPSGPSIAAEVSELLALENGHGDVHSLRFLTGRLVVWKAASESTEAAIGRKAGLVELSQYILVAGVILAAVPSIAAIAISGHNGATPSVEVHNEVHQERVR